VSATHAVTKLLEKSLREFADIKEPEVHDAIYNLINALDTDIESAEYGQSDDVDDKMAALNAAMIEAREVLDESEGLPKSKEVVEKEEEDDNADDDTLDDDDDDDDLPDDED
jgi:segregation and condensation protein B